MSRPDIAKFIEVETRRLVAAGWTRDGARRMATIRAEHKFSRRSK